jgi:hypothetical protein
MPVFTPCYLLKTNILLTYSHLLVIVKYELKRYGRKKISSAATAVLNTRSTRSLSPPFLENTLSWAKLELRSSKEWAENFFSVVTPAE